MRERDRRFQFLSEVLRYEYVGLEEVDDGVWDIHLGPVILGRFDAPTRTLVGTRRLRLSAWSRTAPRAESPEPRAESRPTMPRRTDLHRVLVIGSGPIVIGQACVPE